MHFGPVVASTKKSQAEFALFGRAWCTDLVIVAILVLVIWQVMHISATSCDSC